MVGAILLAAGSGNRMQGEVNDKLLHPIGNSCAFKLSHEAFLKTDSIDCLAIVYKNDSQLSKLKALCEQFPAANHPETIWAGACIRELPESDRTGLRHDADGQVTPQ